MRSKPNNTRNGPWSITFFGAASAGPAPFSKVAKLAQKHTNGLFEVTKSGKASNASSWCQTGTGISVVGFSANDSEPLVLDGTLS